jgi:hypothetical protein
VGVIAGMSQPRSRKHNVGDPRKFTPRPTVHSIWPCGSSVGRNTSLLLSRPNAERFIRIKWMFGHAMLISDISGTEASAASPIRYRLSCTLAL